MNDLSFINQLTAALIFKVVFLFIIFLYIVFTFIIFQQVRSMNEIISEVHSSFIVKILSVIGIVFAIVLFCVAFVIL